MSVKLQNFIPSYNYIHVVQILSFKITYNVLGLLPYVGSKIYYFLEKFLCILLIADMLSEPYLLKFPGNLSLILWEQVSYMSEVYGMSHRDDTFLSRLRCYGDPPLHT